MPVLFQYLIKLSISIAALYLFYQFFLRRLTFYNWNRLYLMIYSCLSFVIPFMDVSDVLKSKGETIPQIIVGAVPVIENYTQDFTGGTAQTASGFDQWDILLFVFLAGIFALIFRLLIQYLSFLRIKRGASLVSDGDVKIYQVNRNIIPFSFANSIFLNEQLHEETDLKEIIRHEFIHIKQKHTIDIIWCELFCALNWYNPFAWLMRKALRQNLEFIADHHVLESGVDKKQYQYLLLKVIGHPEFRIASQFNFSSLKKRIAMMNKMKSAKLHLLKFLFLLPLTAILLLAFRNKLLTENKNKGVVKCAGMVIAAENGLPLQGVKVVDMKSGQEAFTDANGYYEFVFETKKELHVVLKFKKAGYEYKMNANFSMENLNEEKSYGVIELDCVQGEETGKYNAFSSLSGKEHNNPEIGYKDVYEYYSDYMQSLKTGKPYPLLRGNHASNADTTPVTMKDFLKRNPNVRAVAWKSDPFQISIELKNERHEIYNLESEVERKEAERKYGALPSAPPPPPLDKQKSVSSEPITLIADSIFIHRDSGMIVIEGAITVVDSIQPDIVQTNVHATVHADVQAAISEDPGLIVLNGVEVKMGKTIMVKGGKYRVKSLTKDEAVRKYGEKGTKGVLEIQSIQD